MPLPIVRSRTPGLARQETWALLITYRAIRALICHAAAGTGTGRLSFTAPCTPTAGPSATESPRSRPPMMTY